MRFVQGRFGRAFCCVFIGEFDPIFWSLGLLLLLWRNALLQELRHHVYTSTLLSGRRRFPPLNPSSFVRSTFPSSFFNGAFPHALTFSTISALFPDCERVLGCGRAQFYSLEVSAMHSVYPQVSLLSSLSSYPLSSSLQQDSLYSTTSNHDDVPPILAMRPSQVTSPLRRKTIRKLD